MSAFRILDRNGDTTIEWDVKDKESVAKVRAEFERVVAEGYMTFRVDAPDSGELIREFDPTAEAIIATSPMVGG